MTYHRLESRRRAWAAPVVMALLGGCIGNIGGDNNAGETSCPTDPPQRVVLLSSRHYGNAVHDLLSLAATPKLTSAGGNPDALFSGGADRVSSALAFEYQTLARQAAAEATQNLDALLGCSGAQDDACARSFIERFAARAFRRPLAEDDVTGLMTVFAVGREQDGDFRGGIQLAIEAILQSPSFLYRTEIGTPDGDRFRLTPYEVMTELAFFLLDSIPDDALLAAAQEGRLDTPEGVAAEVDRLLTDPAVQSNVTQILIRWFGAKQVQTVQKAAPEFTPELQASMYTETELFLHDLLWTRRGGIGDLFTSQSSWVDEALADFYGIPYPGGGGFVQAELPPTERAGILTHASLLAVRADVDETSVVRRGLFVYQNLLCQRVSPPPDGAAAVASQIAATHKTERARAEFRMNDNVCGACHGEFDPFGLAFESYDATGRYRTQLEDAEPVDASWATTSPAGAAGQGNGAVELSQILAGAEELRACTVRQLASYSVGRPLESKEACHLTEMEQAFQASGGSLVELIRTIAISRLLRTRQEGGQP